jgi:hypothetical protein
MPFNTLTNLIPDAYVALDIVSRELTGFIPSVTRDATADRVAKNQTVRSFVTPANAAAGDIVPSMSNPDAAYQTIDNIAITIEEERFAPFSWTGEEEYAVDQGPGFLNIRQDQIAQAIRVLVNEIETDIYEAATSGVSRAVGTSGTEPFDTNLADSANARAILDDNGAPLNSRSLVINTVAGAKLRTLTTLVNVADAGTSMTLRDGELLNIHGFSVKESSQVTDVTIGGGGSSYRINLSAGYTAGDTSLVVGTGSGTILDGDVVTIGAHKYGVKTGIAAAGTLVINEPGLQETVADGATVTVNAISPRNIALSQNAIVLATRIPVAPLDGDQAIGREVVTDPRTGISFEFVKWPGYDMNTYHVRCAWGVSVLKPECIAAVLG